MSLVRTASWLAHKNNFLARNNFNTLLESAIKIIERQMDSLSFIAPNPVEAFSAPTHLPQIRLGRLVCICTTNRMTREFAPAYLFFAGEQFRVPPDEMIRAIRAVRKELGW